MRVAIAVAVVGVVATIVVVTIVIVVVVIVDCRNNSKYSYSRVAVLLKTIIWFKRLPEFFESISHGSRGMHTAHSSHLHLHRNWIQGLLLFWALL